VIKIGLLAEGEAELGPSVPYLKPENGGQVIAPTQEGALHTLIRRELLAAGLPDCQFVHRHPNFKEISKGKVHTGHGVLDTKYLAQTVVAWQPHEIDMVIILVDADYELEKRTKDLAQALATIAANHINANDQRILNRHAGGLAIKNFDTWLLADSDKITAWLQVALPADLPQNLETLPGNAKEILENAVGQSMYTPTHAGNGSRELKARWELARLVDLERIKERCPQGYGKFMMTVCAVARGL